MTELRFVNPYTFVPLTAGVRRDPAPSQAAMAPDALSGSFRWVLRFDTDLILDATEPPTRGGERDLTYPGSSLRGVLRSLHETIAGGCLRTIDLDYRPVHREQLNAYAATGHTLAVVHDVDSVTGAVLSVIKTTRHQWVDGAEVQAVRNTPPKSGETFHFPAIHEGGRATTWVVHVSGWGARRTTDPYFVALGEIDPHARPTTVSPQAWQDYVALCEGSADLRTIRNPQDTHAALLHSNDWPGVTVRRGDTPAIVGMRRRVDGWLCRGDTVWLTDDGRLKPSAIWRRFGEFPVRDRLPPKHAPCRDHQALCPSCAVFGSVDLESSGDEQQGYASRVRVGFGRSVRRKSPAKPAQVNVHTRELPPLRTPKPSSGGFYLDHDAVPAADHPDLYAASHEEDHITAAHWGALLDRQKSGPRPIRGRKFYWHGQDRTPPARQTERPHQHHNDQGKRQGATRRAAVTPTLAATVTFDNLSPAELGILLLAADPNLLLPVDNLRIHIGGGKPLGFGSARPSVENLAAATARQRYAGDPAPSGAEVHTQALAAAWASDHRPALARAALHLGTALKRDAVAADRIWYPPVGSFANRGTPVFDRSFTFFARNSGGWSGALQLLPGVLDDNQTLPTARAGRRGPLP